MQDDKRLHSAWYFELLLWLAFGCGLAIGILGFTYFFGVG